MFDGGHVLPEARRIGGDLGDVKPQDALEAHNRAQGRVCNGTVVMTVVAAAAFFWEPPYYFWHGTSFGRAKWSGNRQLGDTR